MRNGERDDCNVERWKLRSMDMREGGERWRERRWSLIRLKAEDHEASLPESQIGSRREKLFGGGDQRQKVRESSILGERVSASFRHDVL